MTKTRDPNVEKKKIGPFRLDFYGAFLLTLLTSVRSLFIVNEQAIGYAYGYQGIGA